jgi:predicted O-methyltransferase YrrM
LNSKDNFFWKQLGFAFIDANKGGYYDYYRFLTGGSGLQKGFLFFDNVFLNGQLKEVIQQIFPLKNRNLQGLKEQFSLESAQIEQLLLNPEMTKTKEQGPVWSESVKKQMILLCTEVLKSYPAVLLDSSDGLLVVSKKESLNF